MILHLQEHLLHIRCSELALARETKSLKNMQLPRSNLVAFDGERLGQESAHVADKTCGDAWRKNHPARSEDSQSANHLQNLQQEPGRIGQFDPKNMSVTSSLALIEEDARIAVCTKGNAGRDKISCDE